MSQLPDIPRTSVRPLAVAAVAVCLAATLPYLSTVDDYFLRDDFGVVQLLAQKPASYFPRWFVTSWMDDIWGFLADEIRPFPASSYQLTALGGAGSPGAHHLLNIALHAANTLLVLAAGLTVAGLGLGAATFAALVFALLPAHPESVAWITGRVDTMPAFFYVATFLSYATWRRTRRWRWYAAALGLFFVALFSKQNTITMVCTLIAYDGIVRRDLPFRVRERVSAGRLAGWALPYVPFALLTAGYLGLRYLLFGQVVREDQAGARALFGFAGVVERHLARVVLGDVDGPRLVLWLVMLALTMLWFVARRLTGRSPRPGDVLVFVGPVWWIIGVAPTVVAGYESARHVYLAAMGWGLTLGVVFEVLRWFRPVAKWRAALPAAAILILVLYAVQLADGVRQYSRLAAVSHQAVRGIGSEVGDGPEGGLIIVGVPRLSWDWALPFAVRPPFSATDLTAHSSIISSRALHCCGAQWFDDTRAELQRWAGGASPDSVTLLGWTETPGGPMRLSTTDYPALPSIVRTLLTIEDPDVLEDNILRLLNELVPGPQSNPRAR